MAFKKIVLIFVIAALALFARHTDSSFTESLSNVACRANFYANYTAALATYGLKAKVLTNPFYQGNSTCFVECVIKVMKIQVSSLGVIQAPDFTSCSTGVNTKLQKKSNTYCFGGVCQTLQNIATQVANGTFF